MNLFLLLKKEWILTVIFLLAMFLRLYNLGNIPVGIHGDEASIGYNAYSLLKTLKDQNGNFLPLVIDQFGDFRPAGYHYLDIPFIAVLGLNAWSIRLPSAVFGSAMIILMFLLTQELFHKRFISLTTAFFLAISPWHIIISRATSEGIVAGFLILMGIYFFIKNFETATVKPFYFLVSFLSFFLSFLFYHTARLFVPLFVCFLLLMIIRKKKISGNFLRYLGAYIATVFLSLGCILILTQGAARPSSVSIFNIPGGNTQVSQQIGEDGHQNPVITRLLHNKVLFYGRVFLSSYFQHFNGDFLFNSTGKPLRYDVPWSSVMYLADLPLLLFGFSILLTDGIRLKKYHYLFPLIWLALGALPAGLTYEDLPNVQRASLMIPALVLISAFGLNEILSLSMNNWKRIFSLIYALALIFFCSVFLHNYFHHLLTHEPWHRSAAQKELITVISDLQKKYKKIVMTTEGNNNFIFYIFYKKYDPALFQQKGSPKEKNGLEFENVVYYYQKCPLGVDSANPVTEDPNVIFVNKADCKMPVNADILNTIRHPDGTPAYTVLKVNPFWTPKEAK